MILFFIPVKATPAKAITTAFTNTKENTICRKPCKSYKKLLSPNGQLLHK